MKLISPYEAARCLKKHHSHVYRMIERGEIKTGERKVTSLGVWWDEKNGEIVKSKKLRKE